MTTKYAYREDVNTALATITRLTGQWPDPDDLLHNRNGLPVAVTETHNTDTLPHGLERIWDTDTVTKTRDGAAQKLHRVRHTWAHQLHQPTPPASYDHDARWLTENHHRAIHALPDPMYINTAKTLIKLAQDTIKQCAHGAETTHYPCPDCGGTLTRPYTTEGLMDMYVCDTCTATWTMSQYVQHAQARVRLGNVPHEPYTAKEAAQHFGVTLTAITARIRRHNITPVTGKGRNATYWLDELYNAGRSPTPGQ